MAGPFHFDGSPCCGMFFGAGWVGLTPDLILRERGVRVVRVKSRTCQLEHCVCGAQFPCPAGFTATVCRRLVRPLITETQQCRRSVMRQIAWAQETRRGGSGALEKGPFYKTVTTF